MGYVAAILILLAACCGVAGGDTPGRQVTVGDAFARGSADGRRWRIGTKAVSVVLECGAAGLRLSSLQSHLADKPHEYLDTGQPAAPFTLAGEALTARVESRAEDGRFALEVHFVDHIPRDGADVQETRASAADHGRVSQSRDRYAF